ncbi:MAG: MmgE/PrpD family protein, partial [Rhodospirillales bacterium]|nr:MmgE/PrpD family protein [Rhodospirillales bacterium]
MTDEGRLAGFVHSHRRDQIPDDVVETVKQMLMAVTGTAVAGAGEEGVAELLAHLMDRGGKPEATVLVHGGKLPAPSAALLNGVMCRALDFCDSMSAGLHIGSSLIPAALAAAELKGGCEGEEFVSALVVGAEAASRMNLTGVDYDGFDPTGVAGVFGATAAAARILALDEDQVLNALALAFNRCGGSFQSNVDASLAVRLISGWVAESGVNCALLAKIGFTGPENFISGIYGYGHLFAGNKAKAGGLLDGLGENYQLKMAHFKRYPSCGCTQAVTELTLNMAGIDGLRSDQVESIEVRLPPYSHRLVGHEFAIGHNPRVDAQFNAQYCVASALVRGSASLDHFRPGEISDAEVLGLARRIKVLSDPEIAYKDRTSAVLSVKTKDGQSLSERLDVAPGNPGNPLAR